MTDADLLTDMILTRLFTVPCEGEWWRAVVAEWAALCQQRRKARMMA